MTMPKVVPERASGPLINLKTSGREVTWRWLAVVLWMTAIFVVSSIPSITTSLEPDYDFTLKKLAHVVEYGILTALLFNAVRIHISDRRYALLMAVVVAILYACSDEWHQTFVPGREGKARDVAVDAVGAVGASLWLIRRSAKIAS
jgi:VanZ family protein